MPVIKIKNVQTRYVDVSDVDCIDTDIAKNASRFFCQAGDVLISMTGSGPQAPNSVVGRVARFTECGGRFLINQRVGRFVVRNPEQLDLRFLFFVLTLPEYQAELVSTSTGSANQANISARQIEGLKVPLPPLSVQKDVAALLGALDDKIDLNRRMNETLEATARAVFRDWFVDFGPTRAKMEGDTPYLSPTLWALFPERLDEKDKPDGWQIVPLDETADFLNGLALQKFPGNGVDDLPVIKIAELRSGITVNSGRAANSIPPTYIIEDGDVIFSWSGSLTQRIWTGGKGALNQHLFKVTSSKFPKWLHYLWVDYHLPAFQAIASSKATTMGHIQRYHLSEAETVIGDKRVMKAADAFIGPIFRRLIVNDLESRTLAQTRDLLLPQLLSGEIRIKDAEKAVAELV